MQKPKQIALFGTSADPPTQGHKKILEWLSYHYDQVMVWAADNPLKSDQTPLEHRMTMLALMIDSLATPQNNVVLNSDLSSPRSLETVQKAEALWGKEVDFTFVIGSDLIPQIPRWYASEELLQRVNLLIVPRPGYPPHEDDLKTLSAMGGNYTVADLDAPPVSSTAYRQNGHSDVVDSSVKQYIQRQQLYS
ncbi:nicotinate (nicotinamide) nucleotide adenylyltransferase [Halothece sp. PCC 7418]|uniref:nicotinate-nucleotide adenylyltransferase n=1 Tax=Halothece sp. (strain PCC 7418) TaxID=65093 RepID=UPI0002A07FBE|nr:nicotinate-nucleotide adenylyltransferase [Halothece sp. PCC 7418]AFZ45655.1 nicotinate (nicotinamide) nucleotide adenylyltransferase [Halothece sp. PCC 7418]